MLFTFRTVLDTESDVFQLDLPISVFHKLSRAFQYETLPKIIGSFVPVIGGGIKS